MPILVLKLRFLRAVYGDMSWPQYYLWFVYFPAGASSFIADLFHKIALFQLPSGGELINQTDRKLHFRSKAKVTANRRQVLSLVEQFIDLFAIFSPRVVSHSIDTQCMQANKIPRLFERKQFKCNEVFYIMTLETKYTQGVQQLSKKSTLHYIPMPYVCH